MSIIQRISVLLVTIASIMIPTLSHAASPAFKTPDFAYPQTVEKNAREALAAADAQSADTGVERLRALIELCVAQSLIDRQLAFKQPALVEEQIAKSGLGNASKAMMLCFEAKLYADIYSSSSYKYDRVDAPVEPYPADVSEWSGEQFRKRITDLFARAQACADASPLSDFEPVLTYSPEALAYIPTVADFVRLRRYETAQDISSFRQEIPKICREGIAAAKEASAPFFYWNVALAKTNDVRDSFAFLLDLYTRFDTVEAARYVLLHLEEGYRNAFLSALSAEDYVIVEVEAEDGGEDYEAAKIAEREDKMIKLISTSLEKFPKWYDNNSLRNTLNQLVRPRATAKLPTIMAPGKDFTVKVNYAFAKSVTVSIYSIPANLNDLNSKKISKRMPRVATQTIETDKRRGSGSMSFNIPKQGTYAAVISIDGTIVDTYANRLRVLPVMAFLVDGCKNFSTVVTDFTNGAPVRNAAVAYNMRKSKQVQTISLGTTAKDGALAFTLPERKPGEYYGAWLSYKVDGHSYDFDESLRPSTYGRSEPDTTVFARILTDRQLYHPGDSIEWAVVAGSKFYPERAASAMADTELVVKLFDANDELADSALVGTDGYGRVYGTFATRKGILTGSYRICAYRSADSNVCIASGSVTVSDFKAPEMKCEVTSISRDLPAKGDVTLEGSAYTYSGMPVAGAKVDIEIMGARRYRWFEPETRIGSLEATTDAAGKFTVVVPADMLASATRNGKPYTDFTANVTVTSLTAETATTSKSFTTGKPYTLDITLPALADADKALPVKVSAFDANGNKQTIAITWKLSNKARTPGLPAGKSLSGEPLDIDIKNLAAGYYTLSVAPADTTLAKEETSHSFMVYSVSRNALPADIEGFMLTDNEVTAEGNTVRLTVGTNASKLYLYSIVRNSDTVEPVKLHELRKGFSSVKVELPEGTDDIQLMLAAVLNGRVYDKTVTVSRPKVESAEILAESFRDKLVPGQQETWRFRLCRGKKGLPDAAMIATMYNHALDALREGSWPSAGLYFPGSFSASIDAAFQWLSRSDSLSGALSNGKYLKSFNMEWPMFIFDNEYQLFGNRRIMIRGLAMKSAKAESAESNVLYDSLVVEDAAASMEPKAEVETEEVEEEGDNGATTGAGAPQKPEVEYREAEVLQAFWKPALLTDKDGNVDIVFTVPNANATWQFKAYAWTKDFTEATYQATALANKPVMVQPNLPRFLRQGDSATLLATVFNNSNDSQSVTTTVEIFDIASGKVLRSSSSTDEIAPQASAIVSIQTVAPTSEAAIGYRVRSAAGNFADGEQAAIPVLASAATVIESTEFYLNPGDDKPFEFTLKAAADDEITLQYCQNPIWTVVKAMRGIAAQESLTATGTVSHLFSALAARHIVKGNPDIAKAIARWRDNPSEEALVSMLEKNQELKKLMLDQTPWVQAARSNTARMTALADLLDPVKTENAIKSMTEVLRKMQNADGGFRWGDWSRESSVWTTEGVLTTMALAHSLGMTAAGEFDAMLASAFDYLQKEAVKPKMPETDFDLTLIASLIPELKRGVQASRLIDRTVASIAKGWKNHGTLGKAYDILILNANARKVEAAKVLESVRQFAVTKPGMGLCFPNISDIRSYATIIQAFAAMNAPKAEIDAMRQWITVRAQAIDNLGAYNPDYVIAAVLLTGSQWTSVPVSQSVTVNGKALEIDSMESASGYFSQQIQPLGGKVSITVTPNGVTSSYGSVCTISSRLASSVKARPGRDISIEKRFLVQREGSDQWVETRSFALGEKVRVQLTIKVARDLQYVSIDDERAATLAPVDQLPGYIWNADIAFYRENLDASTHLFISWLPKGTYHISFDMTAATAGTFSSGIATLQSQYAPELTTHSAGTTITVK